MRKGITNDCIALPAPADRLHFTVIYAQLCQIIFLSFVAPTTVSMEMTWHFFEFRMKHLSAKGEEYSCNLHLCSAAEYLA